MDNELSLFDWTQQSKPPSRSFPPPRAATLAKRLRQLSERGVHLGTSSWKYPGWLGQVYTPSRYETRGRFSERKFNNQCLSEYATVFPTVCGDFAFYQFPSETTWERIFAQVPKGFRFSLKVPEEITAQRFPDLPRYGTRAGTENASFMDASLVREQLLSPLESYQDKLGVLIFEFGTIYQKPMSEPSKFAAGLDRMLSQLPLERFKFAVEVRNKEFLATPSAYLDCLRAHEVAHCFNSWTRMPTVTDQLKLPDAFTAKHAVARFLLKPGRTYQQAVEQFSPYKHIQDPYPQGRAAIAEVIQSCQRDKRELFAFVNNRFEGNAMETIEAVTEHIESSHVFP